MEVTKDNIRAKTALEICEEHYIRGWSDISEDHPFDWKAYNLTVVGDAHLPCGKRVCMVKESMEYLPTESENALVFSLQDV